MMTTYLERFKALVEGLQAHPLLEVVRFDHNPPASERALAVAEERLGAPIAEPIRAFYGQTDGLELHWRIRPTFSDEEIEEIEDEYDDYDIEVPEDEEEPFACIRLLPIEDALIRRDWSELIPPLEGEMVEFAGSTYTHPEFVGHLKPFDLFSSYYCMSFFLEEGIGNPKVLLLSDYYAEWDYSRITDFESYLEMLLATGGIVDARESVYSEYRGDKISPLVTGPKYWTRKRIPKLLRVLSKA